MYDSWLDGDWSDLILMNDAIQNKWWEKINQHTLGVYRLIGLNKDDKKPACIRRVCGFDNTGTIYIGKSDTSLSNRLGSLIKTFRDEYISKPHKVLPASLSELFPNDCLAFSWQLTETPSYEEHRLLSRYQEKFGELPPNNGSMPKIKEK